MKLYPKESENLILTNIGEHEVWCFNIYPATFSNLKIHNRIKRKILHQQFIFLTVGI
jgi:hypothetical protein